MIKGVRLINFRNYRKTGLNFFEGIHVFMGANGQGKTNLLESLYFIHHLKSFRAAQVSDLLGLDSNEFQVRMTLEAEEDREVDISYKRDTNKKEIIVDGSTQSARSYYRGNRCFFISNDDLLLITQGYQIRREFLDQTLGLISREYRQSLTRYESCLKKRNDLLKRNKVSPEMDKKTASWGIKIVRARRQFLDRIGDSFRKHYKTLLGEEKNAEFHLDLGMDSLTLQSYLQKMEEKRTIDLQSGRSNFGAHKDKSIFLLEGREIRTWGSQAQMKLFVYALKLTIFQYCQDRFQKNALLLLDDVFSDLDPHRIDLFFSFIKDIPQVFLTCANPHLIIPYAKKAHLYEIAQGKVIYNKHVGQI